MDHKLCKLCRQRLQALAADGQKDEESTSTETKILEEKSIGKAGPMKQLCKSKDPKSNSHSK